MLAAKLSKDVSSTEHGLPSLKGTSPIVPEMQDWSKMPFTSVSSGCFFQLSVNFLKALRATPAFPPKKEERDFTPYSQMGKELWKGSVMGNRQEQKLGAVRSRVKVT